VPEITPPMEAFESRPASERPVPMLRVCSSACALLVTLEAEFYYRGAQSNIKASRL